MTRKTWAWIFVGLWAVLFILAFWVPPRVEPTGDSFVRGMNRVGIFFGFQVAAGVVGFLAWRLGRVFDKPSWQRWLTRAPLLIALAGVSLMAVMIVWANLGGRNLPTDYVPDPDRPATAPADNG